jgi:glycosyltransferase involved in cell wall biosynthesis
LRILTFLHSFEPGGVERVALRLVRRWRDDGIDAPLFMGRQDGPMRDELAHGLDFEMPRAPPFAVGWFETLWMIMTLPAMIRRNRPDALFCAGNSYAIVAVAMKLLLRGRSPPILAKISNDLDRRDMILPVRWLYRRWLRIQGLFIDHFVGMEQPMQQEIAEAIRPGPGRISIIPDPALSLPQIEALRLERMAYARAAGGTHFVAVGRLAAQKNFKLMLRAFAQGAGQDDRLVIYGEGPERAGLCEQVLSLGLEGRVELAGHVPDAAVHIARFDALLLSSDYEGVPAVLIEAMAVGLPIITTLCSRSIPALMRDGALGQIVPVGDVGALASAIGEAADLRQDLVASLDQARRFTLEHASSAYLVALTSMTPVGGRRSHHASSAPDTPIARAQDRGACE